MKTPDQIKNLVTDWSKDFGYEVTDMTDKNKDKPVNWVIDIGNKINRVLIYSHKEKPNFVPLNALIKFGDQHRKQTKEMPIEDYNDFILSITDRLAGYGYNWRFNPADPKNPKEILGIEFDDVIEADALNKNDFIHAIRNMMIRRGQIKRTVEIILNKGQLSTETSSSDTVGKSMYG